MSKGESGFRVIKIRTETYDKAMAYKPEGMMQQYYLSDKIDEAIDNKEMIERMGK